MAPVIAAIDGIRTIRGESNLPPATKIEAQIQTAERRRCGVTSSAAAPT